MPMTLKDVEDYDRKDMLRVEHIHWAITHEVRELKQWNNALTLLTSYLAPVVIASEKAAAAAAAVTDDVDTETAARTENTIKPTSLPTTSKFSDFVEDETTGQYTKQLTEQDVRLIQFSIAALVRYAPTPSESNVVYMFYLQRQPPLRNDETIDNCLISLIYQYAQVKGDPELQAKGLDLIKIALERGVGLPSYQSRTSVKNKGRHQRESILASVSRPILIQQKLQITEDGRALEAYRSGGPQQYQQQGGRPYGQQKQQQGSQPPHKGPNGFPAEGQRQGQNQGHPQGQAMGGRKSGLPGVPGSSSPQPQPQPQSSQPQQQVPQQTQTQTQGKTKPRHRKQDSPRIANKDTQDNNSTSTTPTPTSPRQEVLTDQYDYYTSAPRSFSGTERVKPGSRPAFGGVGGYSNGGKLRTIAFVPASTNPMLKTDHPAPEAEKDKEEDITSGLTERVENLRLDQTSDE
ncbi:hypothetical protein KI688_009624 [Linnemannia hyalina]|uniref:Uncharacterized protein n=1 Tax=Linnemannia hyalina TaxID=64524 RepID=A0A9P8BYS1_9FUNG|nr:hypothetical protein KI688_009624 [Linnemannia hyalina]